VERLTERLGKERSGERDKAAEAMRKRKLHAKYKQAPAVAVVDAGCRQAPVPKGERRAGSARATLGRHQGGVSSDL